MRVVVYEQKENSPVREAFFQLLNGTSLDSVISYWARLRFSGQVMPPEALRDSRAVLEKVRGNRDAIGYVEAEYLDRSVKVVLRLPS
jgi:ABC-type phosphate transport system substrate-binding protein